MRARDLVEPGRNPQRNAPASPLTQPAMQRNALAGPLAQKVGAVLLKRIRPPLWARNRQAFQRKVGGLLLKGIRRTYEQATNQAL